MLVGPIRSFFSRSQKATPTEPASSSGDSFTATAIQEQSGRRLLDTDSGQLVPTDRQRQSLAAAALLNSNSVGQGEFGISRFGAGASQYLQTVGLGPCVALVLYDKTNQAGAMAHNDIKEPRRVLETLLDGLSQIGSTAEKLEARIIGGDDHEGFSAGQIAKLRSALQERNIPVLEQDILGSGSRSIALDTETGEVLDWQFSRECGMTPTPFGTGVLHARQPTVVFNGNWPTGLPDTAP